VEELNPSLVLGRASDRRLPLGVDGGLVHPFAGVAQATLPSASR
jgi:hypothetical protein